MFGRTGPSGKPEPFHVYSMRQAIEEGFILDVLQHYIDYDAYYRMEELEGMSITGRAAAAWIRAVDKAVDRLPRPDLVWSGPEVPGLYARDTRRVYEELLGAAEDSIWACSYAYFDGPRAFEVLARRMDEKPEGLRSYSTRKAARWH